MVTGANGFIGSRVVDQMVRAGFQNVRCLSRSSGNQKRLRQYAAEAPGGAVEIVHGNLLSREDCARVAKDVELVIHLAAGMEKTYAGCFLNSVVTTRNLLDALIQQGRLRRFINVSSLSVYSNHKLRRGSLLDEECEIDPDPLERSEPYMFAKLKQDRFVLDYAKRERFELVILRPGAVYGPGATQITARVGIDTFGPFLHLGGGNQIPLTYVDNCAEAIVQAGLHPRAAGEAFIIVDDDLPTSRQFLRMFRRNAKSLPSISVPYRVFYGLCWMWESYAKRSKGQLPPAFNRRRCETYWKGNRYSNRKLAEVVGWRPSIPFAEAARRYFASVQKESRA